MKKYLISALALVLTLGACTQTALDPLTGVFPSPETATLSSAECTGEKVDGKRLFTLNLSGSGHTLSALLVGNQYYLTANTYSEADADVAKNGNYILGQTTVDGKQVLSGNITVTQEEENYTVLAVLFTTDGSPYKFDWVGTLHFEPDPEPVALTQVFTAQSNLANGVKSVTLSLGTADISSSVDMTTYQTIWNGEGNYLAVDLYSADGYLHEGTYQASAQGGVIGEGEFGIGYDTTVDWGWGPMEMKDWGTCWWTVAGGAATAEKITSGTITVTKSGTRYTIEWGDETTYPKWAKFTGSIDALLPPDLPAPDYVLTDAVGQVLDATWTPVSGVESHTLVLSKDGAIAASFYLITVEGTTNLSGTYACEENAAAAGLMGNGWEWGEYNGGSYLMMDGARVNILAGASLTVTRYAEGLYGFDLSSGESFIAADNTFDGGGEEEPDPDFTMKGLSMTDTVSENTNGEGVETHNVILMSGEDLVANFELVLTTGSTDITGDYLVQGYPGADHLAGNGWSFFGMTGGTYYIKDGETVVVDIDDHFTVSQKGDSYIFQNENFKFVTE